MPLGMKKQKWMIRDLEKLHVDEVLDEIPSDPESVISDVESVNGDETDNLQLVDFDIENLDIVLVDDNVDVDVVGVGSQDSSEYESVDELSLQTLAMRLAANQPVFGPIKQIIVLNQTLLHKQQE